MSKEIYQSLKEMVDMMDCGDEYGKDSPWHQRATKALNEYSHSSTQELLRLKGLECEQLAEDKAELVEALKSSMEIKELWLPMHIVANEHEPEAAPLHKMYDNFKQLLERLG